MRRRVGVGFALAGIAAAVIAWRCHQPSDGSAGPGPSAAKHSEAGKASAPARDRPRADGSATAALEGAITDATTHAAIAAAEVCADGWSSELPSDALSEPFCARSDTGGHYRIANLPAATYLIHASARAYRPELHHADGDPEQQLVVLAVAERRTGIDIALRPGGVEITGTVADLTGGPIAHARVRGGGGRLSYRPRAATETDERGRFSMWVSPGAVAVSATADGYASQHASGQAPGTFELLLAPEASLAGTVVDAATGKPIEGARVSVSEDERWFEGDTAVTGPDGAFRIGSLSPGRYGATARTAHGFGHSEGSLLVGLGQRVDGAVIKLSPALRIEGKLVVAGTGAPCADGDIQLREAQRGLAVHLRETPGGIHIGDGALPGTYAVTVDCKGFASRDSYPPLTVGDKDLTGLVWEVDPGARVRGKITTRSGEPVDAARVSARPATERIGSLATAWSSPDGSYELRGLRPGAHRLDVLTTRGPVPDDGFEVEVPASGVVERNLVLDAGGAIAGTVVDSQGAPVGGMYIHARQPTLQFRRLENDCKSDGAGAFSCEGFEPGDYRVSAELSRFPRPRLPGREDSGAQVTVRAGEVSKVQLVVEARSAQIRGTVLDATSKPIEDAFVAAAREIEGPGGRNMAIRETRWSWDTRPNLSAADGSFTIDKLTPGKYTVRAFRRGGGEAIAQHAATGSTVTLQIAAPATLEGTARRGGKPLPTVSVSVSIMQTGFQRDESFYQTCGHYIVRDLPAGRLELTVEGDGARKLVEIDLAAGEHRTVDIELQELVTVTGRVVEKGTTNPVRGVRMMVPGGAKAMRNSLELDDGLSDDHGKFTLHNISPGKVTMFGMPPGGRGAAMAFVRAERTIEGSGTVDIGDVELERRGPPGAPGAPAPK